MKGMGKKVLVLAIIAAGFALAVGGGSVRAGDMPQADAAALWQYVTEGSPYQGWGYWPGRYGIYEGTQPHGAKLKLYLNGPALKAAREGKPMPNGAIVLKENYGKDGTTLMAVTPMYKVDGYHPEGGDWFWAKYGADGSVQKSGKVEGCIKCHASKKSQDWIFNEVK